MIIIIIIIVNPLGEISILKLWPLQNETSPLNVMLPKSTSLLLMLLIVQIMLVIEIILSLPILILKITDKISYNSPNALSHERIKMV